MGFYVSLKLLQRGKKWNNALTFCWATTVTRVFQQWPSCTGSLSSSWSSLLHIRAAETLIHLSSLLGWRTGATYITSSIITAAIMEHVWQNPLFLPYSFYTWNIMLLVLMKERETLWFVGPTVVVTKAKKNTYLWVLSCHCKRSYPRVGDFIHSLPDLHPTRGLISQNNWEQLCALNLQSNQ